MENKKELTKDMTKGQPVKLLLFFALPLMLASQYEEHPQENGRDAR